MKSVHARDNVSVGSIEVSLCYCVYWN